MKLVVFVFLFFLAKAFPSITSTSDLDTLLQGFLDGAKNQEEDTICRNAGARLVYTFISTLEELESGEIKGTILIRAFEL